MWASLAGTGTEETAWKQILFSGCLASAGHFALGASIVPSGSGDVRFCPFVQLLGRAGGKVLGQLRRFLGKFPQRMAVSPEAWGISPCIGLMAHVSPVGYGDCSLHTPSSPPTFICLLFHLAPRLQGEGQAHRRRNLYDEGVLWESVLWAMGPGQAQPLSPVSPWEPRAAPLTALASPWSGPLGVLAPGHAVSPDKICSM